MKTESKTDFAKITKFTDMVVWQEGHKLVLMVYKMIGNFPKEERYCLSDQTRRAVVSITSCLAEGFTRKSSKEKVQLYKISQGSLAELQNQLLICRDIGLIDNELFSRLANQTVTVYKLLNGLLKATRLKVYEKQDS